MSTYFEGVMPLADALTGDIGVTQETKMTIAKKLLEAGSPVTVVFTILHFIGVKSFCNIYLQTQN
jgi:hypothetical protein